MSAPRLVTALQAERNASSLTMIGLEDALSDGPQDLADVRAATDAEAADVEAAMAEVGDAASEVRPALGALDQLGELRGEVDRAAPGTLANLDASRSVFDQYRYVISRVLDATSSAVATITDEDDRLGADLIELGSRQIEATDVLANRLVSVSLGTTGLLDEPAEISEVTSLWGNVSSGRSAIETLASGTPYEGIARQATEDVRASGLEEVVTAALESGQLDVRALVESQAALRDRGWQAFVASTEELLLR